jgi:hypothetical protein
MSTPAAEDFSTIGKRMRELLAEQKPSSENCAIAPMEINGRGELIGGCKTCRDARSRCSGKCYAE